MTRDFFEDFTAACDVEGKQYVVMECDEGMWRIHSNLDGYEAEMEGLTAEEDVVETLSFVLCEHDEDDDDLYDDGYMTGEFNPDE